MAKRTHMTADEVVERWDDVSGESDDFDDPDETIMEGSDDEFSDLEDIDEDDGNNELDDDAGPSEDPITPHDALDSSMDLDLDTAADSEPQWTKTLKRNKINSFISIGPAVAILKSPLEVFQLFFTPELLDVIMQETNKYAKQVMGNEKFAKWRKMDVTELKALLGFKILMAMNNLPSTDDHWKRDPFFRYSPVADRIS